MKSSATQIITVTHISEVSLFRHDLSHLKVLKSISSSALLLEHFFNRIWTESPQYLKEYNIQSSGLLMILYFFMYPESMDPEETGLNSSNLKYLLIPYFKQLWFSGLTRTTQSNTKLRQPDYPTFVYLLYVFRIYSWMLQIERFSKLALYYLRVPSRSTTKLKHTGCTPQGSGLWVAVSFCSLFLFLLMLKLQIQQADTLLMKGSCIPSALMWYPSPQCKSQWLIYISS